MIFILSFLLSWLSGMFVILVFAFIPYEHFSIVDITGFAVLTFAISLLIVPILYQLALNVLRKWLNGRNPFIYYPVILNLLVNLPVYFIIWQKFDGLYGRDEAILFTLCFISIASVFGLCMAWKTKTDRLKMKNI